MCDSHRDFGTNPASLAVNQSGDKPVGSPEPGKSRGCHAKAEDANPWPEEQEMGVQVGIPVPGEGIQQVWSLSCSQDWGLESLLGCRVGRA